MRLAFVSDIHGNLPALDAVLAAIGRTGADAVVNLGDIVSGPLWPAETADRLMALGVPTIRGNHERQVLAGPPAAMGASDRHAAERLDARQRAWLAALPATLALPGGVYCCHGTPTSDLTYFLETVTPDGLRAARADEVRMRLGAVNATLVACGHTHVPRLLQLGPTPVLNPGSVGLPAYDDDRPYPHVVENGSPHARWALAEHGADGWSVALHATAYDFEAAARQADANGRGAWADALRTGFVGRRERDVVG